MLLRNSIGAGVAAMAILFTTALNNNVLAAPIFADGDVITYSQNSWGDIPNGTNPASLLVANFANVYTGGQVEVGLPGSGFSIIFTGSSSILNYLPAVGSPGPLTSSAANPSSTFAGSFGGDVLALQLDVDFSDAGVTAGTSGFELGDLRIYNVPSLPLLDDMRVRDYLGLVNTLLGGGTGIYTISDLAATTTDLTSAFANGVVSPFAEDHLRFTQTPPQVPEPATAGLVLLGLLALGLVRRRSRILRSRHTAPYCINRARDLGSHYGAPPHHLTSPPGKAEGQARYLPRGGYFSDNFPQPIVSGEPALRSRNAPTHARQIHTATLS